MLNIVVVKQLIGPVGVGGFQFFNILLNGGRQFVLCFCRLVDAVRNPRNKRQGREQGIVIHAKALARTAESGQEFCR